MTSRRMPKTLTSLLKRKTSLNDQEFADLLGMVTEYGSKLDRQQTVNFEEAVKHLGDRGTMLVVALANAQLEAQVKALLDSLGTRG